MLWVGVVVNRVGGVYDSYESRYQARLNLAYSQKYGGVKPYRIAKIVIAK
jgi:hypothetical protein